MEQHNRISATIIADSKNEFGDRITTMLLRFPRIVLAEFNTHRVLSKNSASSRAIPFKRMVKMVETEPFIPIKWMKEHTGMQGKEYFTDEEVETYGLLEDHLTARDNAVAIASRQHEKKLSKQICNRYLEPFMYHTVLVTGTEWENFFALRAHPDAEIHIADLAEKMLFAYNASYPTLLKAGEWHIPYGDKFDMERLDKKIVADNNIADFSRAHPMIGGNTSVTDLYKLRIATARCARTSYMNHEGKDDYDADIRLHDDLLVSEPLHASPAEHCAQTMSKEERKLYKKVYEGEEGKIKERGWCRNYRGFKQYRVMLKNDTATDKRVIKK